ncbi:hypothetical protein [Moraxella caviae]|uniref:hypothetical protein n=1 Tax=Moraxella caviae TaxID=34060 RepID=UPI00117C27A1|nr:hypothetical protein [Moraxella caviae]
MARLEKQLCVIVSIKLLKSCYQFMICSPFSAVVLMKMQSLVNLLKFYSIAETLILIQKDGNQKDGHQKQQHRQN